MNLTRRAILGWAAILFGVAMAVAVVVSTRPPSPAGDVASIESVLRPEPALPSTAPPSQVSTEDPVAAAQNPVPLWQPNEVSVLGETEIQTPRAPVGLTINKLGVDAPVEAYGVDPTSGQMDVPYNVEDVAWYEHGPSPGQPGSAVLAAHVDLYRQGPGVFFNLQNLEPGDRIGVDFDDGSTLGFEVVARDRYDKQELPLDVIFSRSGPPVLTLVTCGGGFDSSTSSYDSNVVVYAVPIPPEGSEGMAQ